MRFAKRRDGFSTVNTRLAESSRDRFSASPARFYRTENRHDYAVPPPRENLLPALADEDLDVVCIGKIASIYDSIGCDERSNSEEQRTVDRSNHCRAKRFYARFDLFQSGRLRHALRAPPRHRRVLQRRWSILIRVCRRLKRRCADDELMMITADHGNDPTFPGSDHTREYAPLLVYGKRARPGVNLGTRESLADIGQTIAENFGLKLTAGKSFLSAISSR